MLKISTIPVILNITSKLDLKPVIKAFKEMQDFKPAGNAEEAAAQIEERKTELGFAVLAEITPQLGKIAPDIVKLAATYKGITEEEAGEQDAIALFKELAADAGVVNFFKSALQKKARNTK